MTRKKKTDLTITEVLDIPLDRIEPPAAPLRAQMSREKLDELKKSIGKVGLIQPIIVQKNGRKYEIIAGHRRYIAFQELKKVSIPAIVRQRPEDENEVVMLHENIAREDISPMDEARLYQRMIADAGLTQEEVAQRTGRSPAYVSQRLALLKAPAIIQEALEDRQISFSVARELMGIRDPAEVERLTLYAIQNGVSPQVARQWRMQWEALNPPDTEGDSPETERPQVEAAPAEFKFTCEGCKRDLPLQELRVMRLCPDCLTVLKEVD